MQLLFALMFSACSWGPQAPQQWVDVFGQPLCPPIADGEAFVSETPTNREHVNANDFLAGSVGFPTEPSIKGELAYFTNAAHMQIAEQSRLDAQAIPIEQRIIEHVGVDVVPFGPITNIVGLAHTATMSEWTLYFESGAVYQYYRRRPASGHIGRYMVILHGCGSSARTVVDGAEDDYMGRLGQHAIDKGWEIVVPYVNSNCFMDNQIDKLGEVSGVNHLAYEIQGIREAIKHANVPGPLSLYGMSKGGIIAGMLAALDSDDFVTVTISGHDIFDFLKSGQPYFGTPHRDKHFAYAAAWGRYMTADEWVMDYLNDTAGRIVIEMSTYDSHNGKGIDTMQRLLGDCAATIADCNDRMRIVWFSGFHQVPIWWTFEELQ